MNFTTWSKCEVCNTTHKINDYTHDARESRRLRPLVTGGPIECYFRLAPPAVLSRLTSVPIQQALTEVEALGFRTEGLRRELAPQND